VRVVKVLAAAQLSLEKNGMPIPVEPSEYRKAA